MDVRSKMRRKPGKIFVPAPLISENYAYRLLMLLLSNEGRPRASWRP